MCRERFIDYYNGPLGCAEHLFVVVSNNKGNFVSHKKSVIDLLCVIILQEIPNHMLYRVKMKCDQAVV